MERIFGKGMSAHVTHKIFFYDHSSAIVFRYLLNLFLDKLLLIHQEICMTWRGFCSLALVLLKYRTGYLPTFPKAVLMA
jgi:hypothetical protein